METLFSSMALRAYSRNASKDPPTKGPKEIFLRDPSDVDDLEQLYLETSLEHNTTTTTTTKNKTRHGNHDREEEEEEELGIRLAQRLLGPPRISLSWKQRCDLFSLLGKFDHLTSITIQGTTMGQVISAELLSTAIPSRLQVLNVEAGMILDELSSISKLQTALTSHTTIREIRLLHFLNHVRAPVLVPQARLLDPLVEALASCPQLQVLELSCLASFMEWKVPLVSSVALGKLLSPRQEEDSAGTIFSQLHRLQLTNLRLEDAELETIASLRPPNLQEILLNGNENTRVGLRHILFGCLSIGSNVTRLEIMNHVKIPQDLYQYVVWYTERYHCPLQYLQVTFPLSIDRTQLQLHLRLHRLDLARRFYSPQTATVASSVQVLAEVSDDPNCLFRLLQEKPSLLCESWRRNKAELVHSQSWFHKVSSFHSSLSYASSRDDTATTPRTSNSTTTKAATPWWWSSLGGVMSIVLFFFLLLLEPPLPMVGSIITATMPTVPTIPRQQRPLPSLSTELVASNASSYIGHDHVTL
jgi:hypothetical protein